jgi:hypothetical protein
LGDTEEGRRAHVRVDAGGGKMPAPEETEQKPDFVARSVMLGSETLGIIPNWWIKPPGGGA